MQQPILVENSGASRGAFIYSKGTPLRSNIRFQSDEIFNNNSVIMEQDVVGSPSKMPPLS